jgi:hypothetical protein
LTFDITGYFLLTCSSVLKPSKVHVERLWIWTELMGVVVGSPIHSWLSF